MSSSRFLPSAPLVKLESVEDLTPQQPSGFCRLVRHRLTAIGSGLPPSKPFVYDWVERKALDAVVVVAYYFDARGIPWVYLRSATRPPVVLRQASRLARADWIGDEGLWEFTAGLIEDDEETLDGVVRCACRELEEELGFTVSPERMLPLGPSTLPSPGVVGERHFFFRVEVEPELRKLPSLDGSALEQLGAVIAVTLADALSACRNGEVEDAKTELGLRRLADELGYRP